MEHLDSYATSESVDLTTTDLTEESPRTATTARGKVNKQFLRKTTTSLHQKSILKSPNYNPKKISEASLLDQLAIQTRNVQSYASTGLYQSPRNTTHVTKMKLSNIPGATAAAEYKRSDID